MLVVSFCGLFSLLKKSSGQHSRLKARQIRRMKSPFSVKELCGFTESVVDAITQALKKESSETANLGRKIRLKAFRNQTSIDAIVDSLNKPSILCIDPVLLLYGAMDTINKQEEEHMKSKSGAKRDREEDDERTETQRTSLEKVYVLFPHFSNL